MRSRGFAFFIAASAIMIGLVVTFPVAANAAKATSGSAMNQNTSNGIITVNNSVLPQTGPAFDVCAGLEGFIIPQADTGQAAKQLLDTPAQVPSGHWVAVGSQSQLNGVQLCGHRTKVTHYDLWFALIGLLVGVLLTRGVKIMATSMKG